MDAPVRLGSSDTCVPLSPGGHSVAEDLPEGGHTPGSLSWGGWGDSAIEAAVPTQLSAPGPGTHISPWHAGGGGESGRFSAKDTHTYLQGGRQRLNWDFCWLATAELSLRYWAACASWQGQVIPFLSAFHSAFASL